MHRTGPFQVSRQDLDHLMWTFTHITLRQQIGPAQLILAVDTPIADQAYAALTAALGDVLTSPAPAWQRVEIVPCCWWCTARGRDHCPTF